MISVLAIILGGDARAIRIARKLSHSVMWFHPFELRHIVHNIEKEVQHIARAVRRAA